MSEISGCFSKPWGTEDSCIALVAETVRAAALVAETVRAAALVAETIRAAALVAETIRAAALAAETIRAAALAAETVRAAAWSKQSRSCIWLGKVYYSKSHDQATKKKNKEQLYFSQIAAKYSIFVNYTSIVRHC